MAAASKDPKKGPIRETKSDLLTPGEKFGDFQVMQCLGSGLLGSFYRMQFIGEADAFTVLVLPSIAGKDPQFVERFRDAALKLSELRHVNILHVESFEEVQGRLCLFMEPVDGVNLNDYLEKMAGGKGKTMSPFKRQADATSKGLPSSQVKDILGQIAQAVHTAHEKGFHHYDLHPGNVIITPDGTVKVSGFGTFETYGKEFFEQIVSSAIAPIQDAKAKEQVTSMDVLSPEIRKGMEPDARSDLFAMGMCGYFLLTGRKPETKYQPPSALSPNLSKEWDRIIARCLETNPEWRYPTVAALSKDLKAIPDEAEAAESEPSGKPGWRTAVTAKVKTAKKPGAKTSIARLAALGIGALLAVAIGSWSIKSLLLEEDGHVSAIKRAKERQAPKLSLRVHPPMALISFYGDEATQFLIKDGALDLVMPNGEYEYSVEAPHFLPLRDTAAVKGRGKPLELSLSLQPAWAEVQLRTLPGARLDVLTSQGEKRFVARAPENGILNVKDRLFARSYDFVAHKKDYYPATRKNISLRGGTRNLLEPLELDPKPGALRVLSNEEGATVAIDGLEMGQAPLEVSDLPVQTPLTVTLIRPGYRTGQRIITIGPNQTQTVEFGPLKVQEGDLAVTLHLPDGPAPEGIYDETEFRLDGKSHAIENKVLKNLPAGEHQLEIEHPDYEPWQALVYIEDAALNKQIVNLSPRPGVLSLELNPPVSYELFVNGKPVKERPDNRYAFPAHKDFEVEIHVRNYLTVKRTASFQANEKQTWKVPLVPIPGPEPGQSWTAPYLGIGMVYCPPGKYVMGGPIEEQLRLPDEGPLTEVTFSRGFWIGKHELAQNIYQALTNKNPSKFKHPNKPVESVTWKQAMAFCRQLTEKEKAAGRVPEGYAYRLPTEAEWEYACRAGTRTPFNFGETASPSKGNFKGLYPRSEDKVKSKVYGTVETGEYEPNDWGIYDMHGNVREWCYDRFNSRLPGGEVTDWAGPGEGKERVVRGGGWEDFAHRCRSSARERNKPGTPGNSLGFRPVLAPEIRD